jgi:hypothetical protein
MLRASLNAPEDLLKESRRQLAVEGCGRLEFGNPETDKFFQHWSTEPLVCQ